MRPLTLVDDETQKQIEHSPLHQSVLAPGEGNMGEGRHVSDGFVSKDPSHSPSVDILSQ